MSNEPDAEAEDERLLRRLFAHAEPRPLPPAADPPLPPALAPPEFPLPPVAPPLPRPPSPDSKLTSS